MRIFSAYIHPYYLVFCMQSVPVKVTEQLPFVYAGRGRWRVGAQCSALHGGGSWHAKYCGGAGSWASNRRSRELCGSKEAQWSAFREELVFWRGYTRLFAVCTLPRDLANQSWVCMTKLHQQRIILVPTGFGLLVISPGSTSQFTLLTLISWLCCADHRMGGLPYHSLGEYTILVCTSTSLPEPPARMDHN